MALYRVEGIEMSANRREVTTREGPAPLRPKTFDVLLYLIRHRGRVVAKQELLDELWPGTAVSENSVAAAVVPFVKPSIFSSKDEPGGRPLGRAPLLFCFLLFG